VDIMKLSFDQWLEIGLRAGFTTPPVCSTHDGIPMTISEDAEFMDGSDPCVYVMRCYESNEVREAVEANCSAVIWRNPYRESNN
jgi:hypothetical protein